VIDERLWFLLKHELRLWHRSPVGLPALWRLYAAQAGTMLLTEPITWAWNRFQFFPFDASAPSDTSNSKFNNPSQND
jgi:hypothetical protein